MHYFGEYKIENMRGSRKFCQRGSNYDGVFLFACCLFFCCCCCCFFCLFVCFFFFFFFGGGGRVVNEGREDPNTTISGPISARQRNAIYMAFHWRANDGPLTLNAGLVVLWLFRGSGPLLLGNLYFCDFSWGPDPPVPPLDPPMDKSITRDRRLSSLAKP